MIKNKRNITYYFFLFLTLNISGQKIKIKKGDILVDKNPIASIEALGSTFNFSNLNDKETKFSAKFNLLKLSETVTKKWLTVSSPDELKKTEIEMEYFSVTMSNKKAIAELFYKKYKIITDKGIDDNALANFFKIKRPSISDQNNQILKEQNQQRKEVNALNINVDSNTKLIYKGGKTPENKIGSYFIKGNGKGVYGTTIITFYDLDKNIVAISNLGPFDVFKVSLPYHKKDFEYKSKARVDFENNHYKSEFLTEAVENLFSNGVSLGKQISSDQERIRNVNREIARVEYERKYNRDIKIYREECEKSINIYNKKGYIVTSGAFGPLQKIEGNITILFEHVSIPVSIKDSVMSEIPKTIGRSFKFIPTKKTDFKMKGVYSASSNKIRYMCIYEKNEKDKRCFNGLSPRTTFSDVLETNTNNSKFYERVPHKGILEIYKDVNDGRYIVYETNSLLGLTVKKLVHNRRKALLFNIKNKEKNIKNIKKYIGEKCYNEGFNNLDYSDISDVKKFVESVSCINK